MNTQLQKITDVLKQYGFKRSKSTINKFDKTYQDYEFGNKKYPGINIRFSINELGYYDVIFKYDGDTVSNTSEKYEDRMEETEVLLKLFRKLKNFKKEEKVVRTKINKRRKLITTL